jgi:hypothetical protein
MPFGLVTLYKMKVPLAFADQFYVLRDHIKFVRDRYSDSSGNV